MRLLLVNSAAPELWGGGEKWFVEAAKWFDANGHDAAIVSRPGSHLMTRAIQEDIECIASKFGGDFDPLAMLRAREVIRTSRSDVVLTNFNKESWQFGVAAKTLKIPAVARHGFTLWSKKVHHRLLAHNILSKLVVNAESIRAHYESLGIKHQDITVITNGVSPVQQKPGDLRKRLQISDDTLLLAAGGRLESQKRFDRLLRIASELGKHVSFKLAIFGTGPHENDLRVKASQLGLDDTATFLGFVPDFASIVGDADLFLLTSEDEGTPNVVLEAMSSGVPVLGFKVGAMESILEGELSEFIVAPDDESQFMRKLSEFATTREKLDKWRSRFRQRVQEKFSFDRSMRQYLDVLQAAIVK
ncbi:MAG: glycosyltransferase family 4 protein [Calditrichaeota bacterium]|nr:glycosyltransferase family 4 protein [Calditrichota bacterium]MCB9369414.1 glycosyltransferase family 4 protein [Calditrichota bacterium]